MGCIQSKAVQTNPVPHAVPSHSEETVYTQPPSHILTQMSGRNNASFDSLYQLKDDLGSGNYSVVKLGVHKENGKEVAVKCTKKSTLSQEDEDAYLTEVKILQSLEHPNIVQMLGFYAERSHYYLVMEVLKGGELFDRIVQKQYYSEKEARDVLRALLQAIKYCHDRNIVHRDLKPENLLLVNKEDDALIKVCDFGFARKVDKEKLATQCGTPGYVAPEILKGIAYGIEVDMWSIGVITFILLGGYPPFHDENRTLLFKKIKRGIIVFHPQYWDHVSEKAKDLIHRMLTLDVSKRITATEALEHPWMNVDDAALATQDLAITLDMLKVFNARRKLRSAIKTVMMTNKLHQLANMTLKSPKL